jgi:hypothetical protein
MKRLLIALCATVPALSLSACAGGYGYGGEVTAGGPYAYDGYYDDYYGSVYDGYWGDDGGFYYRSGANDRHFRRGDPAHFSRSAAQGAHFHAMQGSMTPARGMRMPHFSGGGGHGGPGGGGHH